MMTLSIGDCTMFKSQNSQIIQSTRTLFTNLNGLWGVQLCTKYVDNKPKHIFLLDKSVSIVIIGNHHPSSQMSHFYFGTLPFLTANTKYLCFATTKSSNQLVLCKTCFRRWGQITSSFFQQINFDWCNFYLQIISSLCSISISFMLSI